MDAVRLLLVAGQFLLILLVVRVFELENRTVYHVLALALGGFVVHALLPLRLRLAFFAFISVAVIPLVLGPSTGIIVIGVGCLLIGACYLPIPFWMRAAILVVLGAALLFARTTVKLTYFSAAGWTVLGSMFMFRLALYFHSVRHDDAPHGMAETAAYLFMLPNVAFPLFPVVDYKTFVRTHFDGERFAIYDRGMRFMVRGAVHLLLYRWIYYDWASDERYVNSLAEVFQYVVSTFGLYLRVSGQFHLVVGVICLFGFRLPETHHLYFLSSSLTDFWRRINIYWKDFMMKLVYYPSFFRLRRHGNRLAMAAATLVVFAGTWVLHWYQTEWIRGAARLLAMRDVAFWGILGVVVMLTILWETRPGRRVSRTRTTWSLTRAMTTVATFTFICVLWSLWSMQSTSSWLFMWTQVRYSTPAEWSVLAGLLGVALFGAGFGWGAPTLDLAPTEVEPLPSAVRRVAVRIVPLCCALLLTVPAVGQGLPIGVAETVRHLRGRGDALIRAAEVQLGYYEELTTSDASSITEPWHWPAPNIVWEKTSFYAPRADFLLETLAPSRDSLWHGKRFSTNSWGMRDREYTLAKDPSTYRIALMGPSYVVGSGVADGEPFESLLEARLDSLARTVRRRVEILNFGVFAYSLAQSVYRIDEQVLQFAPDLILLTVSPYDLGFLQRHVNRLEANGVAVPDSTLHALLEGAGFGRGRGKTELRPIEEQIDVRLFQWARELGARVGAHIAVAAFRQPGQAGRGNLPTTFRAVRSVAMPMVDCTTVFDGRRPEDYRESEVDAHPNAAGHRLLAACLFDGLAQHASALALNWLPSEFQQH